ncbi:hypothetical protein GGF37_004198 [Kickxella alabastrina]|nr:hypothetical protein GGF37_004198 [Kickxella alabastrina]
MMNPPSVPKPSARAVAFSVDENYVDDGDDEDEEEDAEEEEEEEDDDDFDDVSDFN